jgi:DNA-binding NtrC family response regulator
MENIPFILVIEDEFDIRNLLERIIRNMKYEVLSAENAQQGLDILNAEGNVIKLVILDLMTPGLTGWEAFPLIRKQWPEIKILISSGFVDVPNVWNYIEPGLVESLPKPYTVSEFQSIVKRLLTD